MTTTAEAPVNQNGLATEAMGGFEVLAQSVAGIAPSAVMATGPALVAIGAGNSVMYSYLVSTVILLMVGWCIARFVAAEGGGTLLGYITSAFGPGAGFIGAAGLCFGYALIAIASAAGFALYVSPLLNAIGIPSADSTAITLVLEIVCMALAAFAMIRGVELSTRVGVVMELISVCAILVVVVAVLATSGLTTAPLHPSGLSVGGVSDGMVLAILGYVGFESAACMGTEARRPTTTVPRAVLGSAVIAAVLYLVSSYAQLDGFGGSAKLTASLAPLNDLADKAGVHALGYLIDVGAAASFFACVTGSLNAASRLVYSMAQARLLHQRAGRAHARFRTPHVAIASLTAACLLVLLVMTAWGTKLTNVFAYTGTIGTYGYMIAYILVTVGISVYLIRNRKPAAAAVVIGGLAAIGMLFVLFKNVYPAPASPYNLFPWLFAAVLVVAGGWYAWARSRRDVTTPVAAVVDPA